MENTFYSLGELKYNIKARIANDNNLSNFEVVWKVTATKANDFARKLCVPDADSYNELENKLAGLIKKGLSVLSAKSTWLSAKLNQISSNSALANFGFVRNEFNYSPTIEIQDAQITLTANPTDGLQNQYAKVTVIVPYTLDESLVEEQAKTAFNVYEKSVRESDDIPTELTELITAFEHNCALFTDMLNQNVDRDVFLYFDPMKPYYSKTQLDQTSCVYSHESVSISDANGYRDLYEYVRSEAELVTASYIKSIFGE